MVINKELISKLNNHIYRFKNEPNLYGDNVYKCYSACKKIIYQFEEKESIKWEDYDYYIDYITEGLDI